MMNEAAYAEANRTYWTHRAPSYGDVNRKELATAQRRIWTQTLDVRIQARFPDRARSSIRVLDVGTGPGFFAVILNALGYAVTAVDYTDAMLMRHASTRVKQPSTFTFAVWMLRNSVLRMRVLMLLSHAISPGISRTLSALMLNGHAFSNPTGCFLILMLTGIATSMTPLHRLPISKIAPTSVHQAPKMTP